MQSQLRRIAAFLLAFLLAFSPLLQNVRVLASEDDDASVEVSADETSEEDVLDVAAADEETLPEEQPEVLDEVSEEAAPAEEETPTEEAEAEETAPAEELPAEDLTEEDLPTEAEETEQEFQTYFEADLDEVFVAVKVPEGAFSVPVEFVVTPIYAGTSEYGDAEDALAAKDISYDNMLAFDIGFCADGAAVEPDASKGAVDVKISLKAAAVDTETIDVASMQVTHISENAVETVADANPAETGTVETGAVEIGEEYVEAITSSFSVDGFSVFVISWENESGDEESATIHWGTYSEDQFTEFESTTTVDLNTSSVDLNVAVDSYYFVGIEYIENDDSEPVNVEDTSVLKHSGGVYKIGDITIADGSNIYVNYAPKGDGSYTPPAKPTDGILAPETNKTVTDNGDGTYTIQLDIEGKQDEIVTQVGANVIIIMDITQSMTNAMPDGEGNRMDAAKKALSALIETLNPGTNLINFTAVNFGNNRNYYEGIDWTTARADMEDYVDGLPDSPTDLGTCWQAGLQGGIDRVGTAPEGNATYVLFVTDGNPNGWVNPQNNYQQQGAGQFIQAAYNAAVDNANTLAGISHLYGIFCGDADGYTHLDDLISNANQNNPADSWAVINGSTTSAIESAFKEIAKTIVDNLGAGNTVVDDGIPTLSNVSANVSAGEAGGFEYFITPKDGTQTEWVEGATGEDDEGAPGASYDKTNGVTWDLGEVGTLKDGWVYTLKFTVWPSQEAYDLIADLNNGKVEMTDEELEAAGIEYNGSTYTLKTNTHLYTTFTDLNGDEYMEINDAKSKAMDLPTTTINVVKYWNNEIDERTAVDVTLTVTKDGKEYLDVPMGEPEKDGENTWKQAPETPIYISFGQIVHGVVKETGHEYTVIEPESFSYHWDLTADIYRPMIVDGEPLVLIKTDEPTGTEGEDYFVIDGSNYQITDDTTSVLTATNDRRSNLAINKEVDAEDAPDEVFAIKLSLDNPEALHPGDEGYSSWDDGIWFSVQTDPYDRDTVVKEGVTVDGATAEDGDTGFYWFDNGDSATVYIKAGQYICITNIAKGTEYTVEELLDSELPDGFVFEEASSAANNKAGGQSTPAEISDNVAEGTIDQSNTDYTVTIKNKYESIKVTVTKDWEDEEDLDLIRPENIEVQLYAGNEEYGDPVTITEDDDWTYTWENLPKYRAGEEIEWSVEEIESDVITGDDGLGTYEYLVTGDAEEGFVITNTHTPVETKVTVTKVWEDNKQDGKRPDSATVQLYKTVDGKETAVSGKTATVPTTDGQIVVWDHLPVYDGTKQITYSVKETLPDGSGYESAVDKNLPAVKDDSGTITITNTHPTGDLTVTKTVDSVVESDKTVEFTFTVTLDEKSINGTFGDMTFKDGVATFTLKNGESKTASGLLTTVKYTVVETANDDFDTEKKDDTGAIKEEASKAVFTNTRITTDIEVKKVWDDADDVDEFRPDSITVHLMNGETEVGKEELTAENGWKFTFEDLPYSEGGKEIKYTVTEDEVAGYTPTIDGLVITNKHVPLEPVTHDPPVLKTITGDTPETKDKFTFTLTAVSNTAGVETMPMPEGSDGKVKTATIEAGVKYEFGDISFSVPGSYVYEIREKDTKLEGYEYDTSVYTLTYEVKKSPDKTKADMTLTVTKDGEKVDLSVYTFENVYTAPEVPTIDVKVTKVWEDGDNKEGIRPDSVSIKLMADGEDTGKVVELSKENNWTYTFTGLPETADGKAIEYTVAEKKIDGYTIKITGDMKTGFTITNTHIPPDAPETGDNQRIGLWIALMVLALAGAGFVGFKAVSDKKRRA